MAVQKAERLSLMRKVAADMRSRGDLPPESYRRGVPDFIARPRLAGRFTGGDFEIPEEEIFEVPKHQEPEEDVERLLAETGVGVRPRTSASDKLQALWDARDDLGLKSGTYIKVAKLVVSAAGKLGIRAATMLNFVNNDMSQIQREALESGIVGEK